MPKKEIINEETKSLAGTKIQAIPKDEINIGIDVNSNLTKALVSHADQTLIDTSNLENFLNISQSREQIYELIDTMSQDSTISAIIETYVEDICEPNDRGEIVWCESTDPKINAYITYLLDTLNIDKNIVGWANKLVKYGDCYLKLYRESDYSSDPIFGFDEKSFIHQIDNNVKTTLNEDLDGDTDQLNEDILISYHSPSDNYVHYVEAEPNPAEMYELTKFGKTVGYIKAPVNALQLNTDTDYMGFIYKTKKNDVTVYQPTDYVHGCVDDNSSRTPEEVEIFLTDTDFDANVNINSYKVKRGQSLLYNAFRVWRLLSLLENAVALNRINKSSILRILEIECGDMSPQGIQETLQSVKNMVEQKTALKKNGGMAEYVNPGPIENTIYLATKGEIGKINTQELGSSDSDPKNLLDLDYYNNKLFGSLRVPKQYFAETDDGAGFNGGESLSIISSRYGKAIKKYQNYLIQMLEDLINLLLIDKKLDSYINNFTLKMQPPVTKEMLDRKEQSSNEIGMIRDLMDIIGNYIEDPDIRLEALKVLLSSSSQDSDLIQLVDEEISKNAEESMADEESTEDTGNEKPERDNEDNRPLRPEPMDLDNLPSGDSGEGDESPVETISDELPSFDDLGLGDAVDIDNN